VLYQKTIHEAPQEILFAPKKVLAYREAIYLAGWRVEKRHLLEPLYEATLALQRVRSVETTRYSTINIEDPAELADGAFGMMLEKPFKLIVRFKPELATYISERQWSEDQEIKLHRTGELTLTMTSRNRPEALSWLMGFGPAARLLAPAWLAAELRAKLTEAAALYKE
jgi:predicted DNA-binding transcriptional regulator YafY